MLFDFSDRSLLIIANGAGERVNRTLLPHARSMLYARNISNTFLAEALSTAVLFRNRIFKTFITSKKTKPHFFGLVTLQISLVFEHFEQKVLVCGTEVRIQKARSLITRIYEGLKFSAQQKLLVVGYQTKKLIISRDVKFDELISVPQS